MQKERLQRGADGLEKKRGALLAQIAALKEVRGQGCCVYVTLACWDALGGQLRGLAKTLYGSLAATGLMHPTLLGLCVLGASKLRWPPLLVVINMQAGGVVEGELASLQEQVDKVAAEVRGGWVGEWREMRSGGEVGDMT